LCCVDRNVINIIQFGDKAYYPHRYKILLGITQWHCRMFQKGVASYKCLHLQRRFRTCNHLNATWEGISTKFSARAVVGAVIAKGVGILTRQSFPPLA
jgi:hypothetical protein